MASSGFCVQPRAASRTRPREPPSRFAPVCLLCAETSSCILGSFRCPHRRRSQPPATTRARLLRGTIYSAKAAHARLDKGIKPVLVSPQRKQLRTETRIIMKTWPIRKATNEQRCPIIMPPVVDTQHRVGGTEAAALAPRHRAVASRVERGRCSLFLA